MTARAVDLPSRSSTTHRSDIDGLRAFAVSVVVAFHASFPGFDGGFIGVDVFFVISGFLITGVLLRELDEHDTIRLRRFWARRIRRLLPASTLVVIAALAATVVLLSPIAWKSTAESAAWAAGYAQNIFLAGEQANYFAPETRNPFVHFWSLAIEEQFYVLWPLVMLALVKMPGRADRRTVLTVGLSVLALASFVHSVMLTGSDSTWDYYSPLSRGWEFAAGGLLALAAPTIARWRTAVASLAATVAGAGLLAYSLLTLDGFTPFPGWRAVPPVLGTVLLIAAHNTAATPVGRLLDLAPVQWLGRMSYGWYLWHFPFLIIAEQYLTSFGPVRRLAVVLAALAAAALSYSLLEHPVRFSERLRRRHGLNYAMAIGLLGASLAVAGVATVLANDRLDEPKFVELETAAEDFERLSDLGCPEGADVEVLRTSCVVGDPNGDRTLLVLGDSHADQWIPALEAIGAAESVSVHMRTVVACPALPSSPANALTQRCLDTQADQLAIIDELAPDAVFVAQWTGSFAGYDESTWTASVADFGDALAERGIDLFWMHDGATFASNPLDCLGIRSESDCTPARFTVTAEAEFHRDLVRTALADTPFREFDPLAVLCNETTCPLRFDGELVYRDSNHLTAATARNLVDELTPALLETLS